MIGITGQFHNWLTSYITNRLLYVKINSVNSDMILVPSGVPQGSHLGPILFNIFINDISLALNDVEFLLYADDLKVYRCISDEIDCEDLQSKLSSLENWCRVNLLSLNISKCKKISFFKIKNPISYKYELDNIVLQDQNEIMDLGITFDSKLLFNSHIKNISCKSMRMLGFVLRSGSEFKSINTLLYLYTSLVRPILEYCSIVWNPLYDRQISAVQRVQNKLIKILKYRYSVSSIELIDLADRRTYFDMLFLYKLINGIVDSSELLYQINFKIPNSTRHQAFFYPDTSMTNYEINSTINRLQITANRLNIDIDTFNKNIYEYKRNIRSLMC